jgi:hypothetical protein
VADRDGLYVVVSLKVTLKFRYDYRLGGRRETLTVGQYEEFQASQCEVVVFLSWCPSWVASPERRPGARQEPWRSSFTRPQWVWPDGFSEAGSFPVTASQTIRQSPKKLYHGQVNVAGLFFSKKKCPVHEHA